MKPEKRAGLEAAGFRVGDAEDFLGLTEEEARIVELRVRIGREVRRLRESRGLTQKQLAAALKTTQPRVARIEASAADVSLDQMFRGFFVAGGTLADLVAAPVAKSETPKGRPSRRPERLAPRGKALSRK